MVSQENNEAKFSFEQITIFSILILGVILTVIQYADNRSLWLDEAMLSLNIINKDFSELLNPLDYGQVAPILFLQIENIFYTIIPNSEYGLRLLPLISFFLALYFFYRILKINFQSSHTIIFALSLFVFNNRIINYATEVKQYMVDVLLLTLIYFLLINTYKKSSNKFVLLGIVGMIGIWVSNVAPIVLFSAGIYLFYEYLKYKEIKFFALVGIAIVWGVTFLVYFYLFIHDHPLRDYMTGYWANENAFMPTNFFSSEFVLFWDEKYEMLFGSLLRFGTINKYPISLLFIIGIIICFKRNKKGILYLILTPIILHLALSALKLYPFDLRLILYMCPILILAISYGFDFLIERIFSGSGIFWVRSISILVIVLTFSILISHGFPIQKEEMKETLIHLENTIEEDESIYVHYAALPAFNFYLDIDLVNIETEIVEGNKHLLNRENYIKEINNLTDKNWLVFSHKYLNDELFIIQRLDSLGYKKLESFSTYGSSVYLYDFDD